MATFPDWQRSNESFHAYALRTGLSPTSTVYTGTAYEYLAKSTLQPYGFNLHRVGGRGDRGVDLVGVLEIPVLSRLGDWKEKKSNAATYEHDFLGPEEFKGVETHQLKLLVQCKRLAGRHARIGPNLIRELDGAIRAARSATLVDMIYPQTKAAGTTTEDRHRGSNAGEETRESNLSAGPAIGVLVGTRPATKGVVDSMSRSTRGLVWIMMEEVADQDTGGKEIRPPSRSESMSPLHSDISPPDTGESPSDSEPEPGRSSGPPGKPPHSAANLKGRIKQILWNQAAREAGLEGVDVVKRYDSEGKEEVVLMRGGRVWGGS
ncbi:uncharacterized protein A1O5_04040 [Cladophialophora psammophila CBS 110553]|uniref:Required for respiratory growth protein 7, mitochondrial n=1 Tax=Cladophialophora psammophila CBS 110553 TaxID=1182543 RepID=W9WXH4_9EURO|nr:uncharacterized protein A1O5_04040 [Cladophialophora psammophila CBS 110553]EXJ72892.1 hypothetical protein A1O5_04040 [Cladophialophora psammophila CBS 110553]